VCPSVDGFISLKASPPQILSPPVFLWHSQTHTTPHTICVCMCHTSTRRTDVVIGRGSFIAHVVLMRATSTRHRFVSPHFTKFALRPYQIKTYTLQLSSHIYNISLPNINHSTIIVLLPDLYHIISYYLIFLLLHRWSRLRERPCVYATSVLGSQRIQI